ncbi:hypothetical protein [Lignipirellula cremea]|uniref:Sulfatase n=1 Tax=Lignipirellula cremea TaxID=2528010 RepID=A0A518DSL4_9BACT|nr:hypothetical protein [Lignipirellula cremea]QDU94830.1 hypothetical protein Pla8534_26380 [Lignipirellula cremea]
MQQSNVLVRKEEPRSSAPFEGGRFLAHPMLAAIFPPLLLYAQSPGKTSWQELALALAASAAMAGLLLLLMRYFFVGWRRAALAATWLVCAIYAFWLSDHVNGTLAFFDLPYYCSRPILLALWAVLALGGLTWFFHDREDDREFTHFANIFALAIVLGPLGLLGWHAWRNPQIVGEWQTPAANTETFALHSPEQQPDIYYLVLNAYAGDHVLRRDFQFDNRVFLAELARRGFVVAESSRANYPQPELSLASTLNMAYLGDVDPGVSCRNALQDHRVGELLKEQGYLYFHLGIPVDGLWANRHADYNYRFSLTDNAFTERLIELTPLRMMSPNMSPKRQTAQKFEMLPEIAKQAGPKFVVACFDSPGLPQELADAPAGLNEDGLYLREVAAVNQQVLATIDALTAASDRPPVILLQSAQGPDLSVAPLSRMSELEQVRARCSILSAFRLPGRRLSAKAIQGITPVNTFRMLFDVYFDAKLPMLANRTFYWSEADSRGAPSGGPACRMVEVTQQLAEPAALASDQPARGSGG